jgi:hypothetical protein
MTRMVQRLVIGLAVLMCFGLSGHFAYAADTSKVGPATKQVESGAKQAGQWIEQTAKGIGNTVAEGAKATGQTLQEAEKSAQPQAERAWDKVKNGAEAAGASVQHFFNRLFGH